MEIEEIEQLVSLVKDAKISELSVTTGSDRPTKLVIRKTLTVQKYDPSAKKQSKPAERKSAKADLTNDPPPISAEMYVNASMVGIFHGLESISSTGALIRVGQVIGSIESMKLMNDIVSEYNGVISEIMVEEGMPVEYGQQLFKVNHL